MYDHPSSRGVRDRYNLALAARMTHEIMEAVGPRLSILGITGGFAMRSSRLGQTLCSARYRFVLVVRTLRFTTYACLTRFWLCRFRPSLARRLRIIS